MKEYFNRIALMLLTVTLLGLSWMTESSAQGLTSELMNLSKISSGIKSRRVSSYDTTGYNNDSFVGIKVGETRTIFGVEGAGMINHIWITMAPRADVLSRNDVIIRMYWDGQPNPSVCSPIGPFFGQGWEESYNFSSLPLAATPDNGNGLVSYFSMPFANGARITIENQSDETIGAFYFYVDYIELPQLPADNGRFHAWYNHELTEADPQGENEWKALSGDRGYNKKGDENYLVADIHGKGHFVGVNYYIDSPSPMWYGEGDDMFYIDGDTIATLHGTGTEDYFNTAWSPKEMYNHPYFGYARVNSDHGWLGRTHVYRFHITDPVFFDRSLRFSFEHGHNNVLTLDLASVAYWYQDRAVGVPDIVGKKERKPKQPIDAVDIHRWRHEWRKNHGSKRKLWGNESKTK